MNKELNRLVSEYKSTKNKELLNFILIKLEHTIQDKAKFVFYRKEFYYKGRNFYLYQLGTIDLSDVKGELKLYILKLIKKYDTTKPFDKYLYSSIWNWGDSLLKNTEKLNVINKSIDEYSDLLTTFSEIKQKIDFDFIRLTKPERKLLQILKENPEINQSNIAEVLQLSEGRISQIFKTLRKKIKKYLTT